MATLTNPRGPYAVEGARWHLLSKIFSRAENFKEDLEAETLAQEMLDVDKGDCEIKFWSHQSTSTQPPICFQLDPASRVNRSWLAHQIVCHEKLSSNYQPLIRKYNQSPSVSTDAFRKLVAGSRWKNIGGWVEVDWWLRNLHSVPATLHSYFSLLLLCFD